jgi:hypothetical protein
VGFVAGALVTLALIFVGAVLLYRAAARALLGR